MNKTVSVATIAVLTAIGSNLAGADTPVKCAARPNLPAPCYQVHGRLNAWNGGPSTEKIWVIGTKRLLGIYDRADGKMTMPKTIADQLDAFETKIYADYLVCPLEKEMPGHQSYVCIESAKNIRVERHETVDGRDRKKVEQIPDAVGGPLVAE